MEGLKVGELFVDLGIEGGEKSIGLVSGVRTGLKDTASAGLETKAAMLGAMYAVQQLFSTSNRTGADLRNFNSLLGMSAQTLQQYQYAARQVNVSNGEMEGTFKALQSTVTRTLLGEGAPKGLARVSMLVGGMDAKDLKAFSEHPEQLLQKLQQYAQKETDAGLRNEVLKSFGISDGVSAALRRNAFRPEVLRQAPTYSDNEIASLDKANAAWSNLGNKIEMAIGRFNARHGGDLVKNIDMIATKVLRLADSFVKLAEKLQIFETIGKVFEGWGMIFDEISAATDDLEKKGPPKSVTGQFIQSLKVEKTAEGRSFADENKNVVDFFKGGGLTRMIDGIKNISAAPEPGQVAPAATRTLPPQGSSGTQNTTINQTMNFQHPGVDPKQTSDSTKKAIRDAYRQMPQSQGN